MRTIAESSSALPAKAKGAISMGGDRTSITYGQPDIRVSPILNPG